MGRPVETVRRVVQVGQHRDGCVLHPAERLEALRRVGLPSVEEHVRLDPLVGIEGRHRNDVVPLAAPELDLVQNRPLPVDSVVRDSEAVDRRVLLSYHDDSAVGPEPGVGLALVEHLEDALPVVEEDVPRADVVALPGHLGPQYRVVVDLPGRVHDPHSVARRLDQVVVDEELLPRSDVDEGHTCASLSGGVGYHRRTGRMTWGRGCGSLGGETRRRRMEGQQC